MGKKKGKGKSQESQGDASSSAQSQPTPSQPPQGAPAPRQPEHESAPQQAAQQSKKKKGGKGQQGQQAPQSKQQTPSPSQEELSQKGPQQRQESSQPPQQQGRPQQMQRGQPQQQQSHVQPQLQVAPPQGLWGQPTQWQRGQVQYPQMGQPQYPPQQHPQMSQPQHPQMGQPQHPQMGQPQHFPQHQQMGQPQHTQMGQPRHPQMGQPRHPQMGQPRHPQMGQPRHPQMGQPQHSPQHQRMGQPRHPQMGQPQHSPQHQQMGQPQYPPQQPQAQFHPQQQPPQDAPFQQGGRGRPQQGQPPQQMQSPQQMQQQPQKSPQHQQEGGKGRGKPHQAQTQQTRVSPPTQQMAKLQVDDLPPMQFIKVQPGTLGRKIHVETNHLQLNLGKLRSAIHYDVNLVPDTPKKYLRLVVELFRQKHFPKRYPAFDGRKNLYSTTRLPFDDFISDEIVYKEPDGRDRKYKVEIKFANEVDLTPLQNFSLSRDTPREALQVVDIVLRSAPAINLISVGRSFFSKPTGILDLGEGMEMYNGFYQSAIRGWKPFLNVDVAHKAFPKNISVTDALVDLFDSCYQPFRREDLSKPLDGRQRETFEKYIKTLRVTYEIPGNSSSKRSYRVNGIDRPPREKVFKLDNGKEMTIENYFATLKGYRLRYPHLPSLWVGDRNRPTPILLPLELCVIEQNQAVNRKMTENQTSKMIKYAATNTEVRKQKITTALRQANHNQNQTVLEFGFSVANEFEKLEARVLQPPTLQYNQTQDKPFKGVWRGNKFFVGVEINKWTIACADRRPPRPDDLNRLADMILKTSSQCGMQIKQPAQQPFITMGSAVHDIKKFFQTQKDKQYDVIFVVVPNSGQQYSFVKSAAEINTGCLTQCIKMNTVCRKLNPQTVTNILLKVNAKLNGTNHCLLRRPPIMDKPCMIMGADVTHPSPDSQNIPSVAAVTASHDPKAFKYNICWRLQPPKVEIIEDLEAITVEQLKYFYEKNRGMKPERIVFFRDGVSEGQFDQVRQAEIRAIRSACKKVQASDYEPKITFLVVQKRHHTRLFPTNPRDSEDKNFNVPAGTCVDTTITHPFLQDFYLVSHASIQGVAKPTKYCTLWDDNDMSHDEIEALTYHLCHMFTRCNRSVSYPAPTYYAHLAAARAKVYIENDRIDLDNLQREFAKYPIQDVIRKEKPMFFV
ncbi:protein argonaute-2 [Leptinotarsa decemlineata]|uniref:protein argonaute-2 n=1 Tax=Leptinotarsa decemlineata TaxID=7539 RepID=UPI003D30A1FA